MPLPGPVVVEGATPRRPAAEPWTAPVLGGQAWRFATSAVRSLAPLSQAAETLGQSGSLEVRLAASAKEVGRAQRLRYRVFFEERSAMPGPLARLSRRDADAYDPVCDHLVVLDHDVRRKPFRAPKPKVVGTYRLLRRDVAERHGGFYSAGEFDLGPLLAAKPEARFLELGRSCVLKPYRTRKTVELLWQGLWAYVQDQGMDAMIGCASLEGTDPQRLASQLGYLHHYASSPVSWRVRAWPALHVPMDLAPREALNARSAFKELPPLVKGYLRVGATFGDGAVVDRAFGTTDVFAVMPVEAIQGRYIHHFGPAANRQAA